MTWHGLEKEEERAGKGRVEKGSCFRVQFYQQLEVYTVLYLCQLLIEYFALCYFL